jgi:hypothetical protein
VELLGDFLEARSNKLVVDPPWLLLFVDGKGQEERGGRRREEDQG